MRADENMKDSQTPHADSQTSNAEKSSDVVSLVQPLPKPDPVLKSYAEASEKIDQSESTSDL